MCRNHRGFVEATVACSKLGASALYLNTAFAGPQITDVLAREEPAAVIYDEDFANLVAEGAASAQALRRLVRARNAACSRRRRPAPGGPDRARRRLRPRPARRARAAS